MGTSSPKHKEGWSPTVWLWTTLVSSIFLIHLFFTNPFRSSSVKHVQDGKDKTCDLTKGRWVRNPSGPLYTRRSCPTLPDERDCENYGKDMDYANWRWKPDMCDLPQFDPKTFLNIVQGKKMAFIGDSLARNQHDSLRCLLSQVSTPKYVSMGDDFNYKTWYFPSHNFTLINLHSRFLVEAEERMKGEGLFSGIFDINVDKVDPFWTEKLPGIDIGVISDGNWFFRENYIHEGGNLIGCTYCKYQNETKLLDLPSTIRKAFTTALRYISSCESCVDGILTIVRTLSPVHYKNGEWNTGGYCNRTGPMSELEQKLEETADWEIRRGQVQEIARVREGAEMMMRPAGIKRKRFEVLDVARAMSMREDGHPDAHWKKELLNGYHDCVHWCLPGPVDLWNDLLLALLHKST